MFFSVGASPNTDSRLSMLNHKLMCQCGCAQLLGECDHVGCPSREGELNELSADVAAGGPTDQQVLDAFAAKYGAIVLAAPTTKGFDLVAWIAPFAVFGAALLGTILLIPALGRVGAERGGTVAATAGSASLDPAERERRERIRRETGMTGEFKP